MQGIVSYGHGWISSQEHCSFFSGKKVYLLTSVLALAFSKYIFDPNPTKIMISNTTIFRRFCGVKSKGPILEPQIKWEKGFNGHPGKLRTHDQILVRTKHLTSSGSSE